ncbi:DUF3078 domain-containing protein [Fulvivirgaceae bacterium BMA10]|uniref:DUF3078 domain-containing protein n=1 Tax=Splendidivirga corallicola TaxID=3051826 RepID=A0ABT8KVQ5_9BACT|nr:DUF3078 domain-containing protein [Fulvivirgaceae bacterium BMA10]
MKLFLRFKKSFVIVLISLILLGIKMEKLRAQTDTTYWQRGAKGTLTFSQVSLTNWSAGGENSISLNAFMNMFANYAKGRNTWKNTLELGYGLVDQGDVGFRKSDDKINFSSQYGYQLNPDNNKLFWSTLFDFKTQFSNGFNFPEGAERVKISGLFAPAYLLISTGLEYKPSEFFSVMFSPTSGKITIVSDQDLADLGAFGVDPGKTTRVELGTYLTANFKKDIAKNVNLESRLELFTGYDENFGNIDVNWQNALLMKVNDWLSANLITQLLYDDDILIDELDNAGNVISSKPRVQFKQIFGVGLSYTIGSE